MNKVSFANLKLKVDKSVTTFKFNETEIEVLNYLPIEDKYDLIMITLQKAKENGVYNPLKLDIYFHLHLVYMYTNLSFTDKQRENELKLYDCLASNGFIYQFMNTIEDDEYNYLFQMVQDTVSDYMNYHTTAGAVIQSLINDLPRNAEAASRIVESFNPEKYEQVIQFAEAANGGRPLRGLRQNIEPVDEAGKID